MRESSRLQSYRVELLSDSRGIYGLTDGDERSYSLRSDRIRLDDYRWYALQQIPKPRFCHTVEADWANSLHRAMCARHGLLRADGTWRSWSEAADPKAARQIYHGLKRLSLRVINSLIRQVLDVADPRALKSARKFPISCRANLYKAFCAYGERAIQLSETFPLLAAMLFTNAWSLSDGDDAGEMVDYEKKRQRSEQIRLEHIELVLAGVKLKRISDSFGLRYRFRRVKPGAVGGLRSIKWFSTCVDYLPATTRAQRMFFRLGGLAQRAGLDFAPWMAELTRQSQTRALYPEFDDVLDWVKAAKKRLYLADGIADVQLRGEAALVDLLESGRGQDWQSALFTRPYSPNMALRTVRKLSREWHEAVAKNMRDGELQTFPSPWIDGAEFDDHKIIPIRDSRELYLASKTLHNCAATYADAVVQGQCYLYSVTNGDGKNPVAMVELVRQNDSARVGQIKGYCNGPAPKQIERGIKRWLDENKCSLKLAAKKPAELTSLHAVEDRVPDELPFITTPGKPLRIEDLGPITFEEHMWGREATDPDLPF